MSFDAGKRGLLIVAGVALAGCGHSEAERTASVGELNRTVQSLRAQNTAYAKQVEELENRVFIMSDQMDSKREAPPPPRPQANPALPKVTLHPAERASTTIVEEPADDPSEVPVEYAGEAAKTTGKRPLLRLYGDDVPVMSTVEHAAPPAPAPREKRVLVMPRESRQETRPAPARAAVASEGLDLYRRSLEALRGGRHVEAAAGFRDFLKQHPNHDFADNAQYWLAECYYDQKDYPMAMREFRRVVEKYPQGNKVPDALLKVGFAHLALGSTEVGRQTLEQVIRSYPRAEAASLATAKLGELGRTASKSDSEGRPAQEAP
jgi:tol-pal system protein YbgF